MFVVAIIAFLVILAILGKPQKRPPKPRKAPESEDYTENSFFTKVAGVTQRNDDGIARQSLIADCKQFDQLYLQREPRNLFDTNAIKVTRENGDLIGYIPAHVASRGLAEDMDSGLTVKCVISDITGGTDGRSLGVNLSVSVREYFSSRKR